MTHEEIQQQLDAYALGALDDVSKRRIDSHLAESCRDCADQLNGWNETVSLLAYATNPVAPSASVKANLLSRINNHKSVSQSTIRSPQLAVWSAKVDWRGWAVAAVLLIAFGVVFVHSMSQSRQISQIEVANLKDRAQIQRQAAVLAILEAKDATITPLSPAGDRATSSAKVIWSASQKRWTLLTERMAGAPANKSYQLWFIVNDQKISGGVFDSPDEIAQKAMPPEVTHADMIAITLEKSGGSSQPEGPTILAGKAS